MSENNDQQPVRTRSEIHAKKRQKNQQITTPSPAKKKLKLRYRVIRWVCLGLLLVTVAILGYVMRTWHVAQNAVETMYQEKAYVSNRAVPLDLKEVKPFSILILGVDTGEYGRLEKGRTDAMMVVTVNAQDKSATLTSIPRDTYTEIIGYEGGGYMDKINHAYAYGGTEMAVNSVQNLLDIPIDYTISVDMGGFEKVVDAVGGVDITPNATFVQDDKWSFEEGVTQHMDGATALAYTRNRYVDSDYGRQERIRQTLSEVLKKAASLDGVLSIDAIIKSLQGNVITDMSFDEMMTIATNYISAANHIEQLQLQGTSSMIDDVYYEQITPESLNEIQTKLKASLGISDATN